MSYETQVNTLTQSENGTVQTLVPEVVEYVNQLNEANKALAAESFTPSSDKVIADVAAERAGEDEQVAAILKRVEKAQAALKKAQTELRDHVEPRPSVDESAINAARSSRNEAKSQLRVMVRAILQVANKFNLEAEKEAATQLLNGVTAPTSRNRARAQKAREWLKANGHEVNDKGRIPERLMELVPESELAE